MAAEREADGFAAHHQPAGDVEVFQQGDVVVTRSINGFLQRQIEAVVAIQQKFAGRRMGRKRQAQGECGNEREAKVPRGKPPASVCPMLVDRGGKMKSKLVTHDTLLLR